MSSKEIAGLAVVMPPGSLACHVDAMRFIPHVPQTEHPAGALSSTGRLKRFLDR